MPQILSLMKQDYDELSCFLSRPLWPWAIGRAMWLSRFHLWWDDNPAFGDDATRGWLLKENNEIVGFYGIIPSRFQCLGKEMIAFSATSWYVLPAYRNQSLQLLYKIMNASRETILFSTTPSDNVIRVRNLLKFKLIPKGPNIQNATSARSILLNFEKVFILKAGKNLFSRIAAKLLNPFFNIYQAVRLWDLRKSDIRNVKEVIKANSSFNRLWEKTKTMYLNTNVRTAEVLNWYCFGKKGFEKKLFGYFENDNLRGYIICREKERKSLRILECLDLWIDYDSDFIISALVNYVWHFAEKNPIDLVIFPHFTDSLDRHLKNIGLMTTQLGPRRDYFKCQEEISNNVNESNSYFVGAQGDYGL
jgi:hypothetical protein